MSDLTLRFISVLVPWDFVHSTRLFIFPITNLCKKKQQKEEFCPTRRDIIQLLCVPLPYKFTVHPILHHMTSGTVLVLPSKDTSELHLH